MNNQIDTNEQPINTKLSIEELSVLKEGIKNTEISSSESSDIDDDSDYDTDSSSVSKNKKKKKNKKIYKNIPFYNEYININKKLESRIHYMKLDIINRDLELEELRNKMNLFEKNLNIFKNINFLFERLDNSIKVLNERLNSKEDPNILKYLYFLEHTNNLCYTVNNKYELYLNDNIIPLLDDNIYLKKSIILSYQFNKKELLFISSNINKKILYFQRKQFLIQLLYFLPIIALIVSYVMIQYIYVNFGIVKYYI